MKKKKVLLLLPLIALLGFFIPFDKQNTVDIHYPYYLVFNQLKPEHWLKWQPALSNAFKQDSAGVKVVKNAASFTFTAPYLNLDVKTTDGFSFAVKKLENNKENTYGYVVLPSKTDGSAAIVVIKRTNLFSLITGGYNTASDIDCLKRYMNNASLYYGFNINKVFITDTCVVVQKRVVAVKEKQTQILKVQQELNRFVTDNKLKQTQPLIADIRNTSKDSVQIMMGIPIDRKITASGKFLYMHLPPNGKMLIANYKGRYEGRQALYTAMRTYIADHALSTPELPFEKFLDNKIPLSDTALVDMEINYPVF